MLDTLAALTDDNISSVKQLVTVITNAVSSNTGIPCTTVEKTSLKTSTSSKVTTAKEKVNNYKTEKDKEITDLHAVVKAQTELIETANNQLAASGQATIPADTIAYTQATTASTGASTTSVACKAKDAVCKAADTCCDSGRCQDDAGKDVTGETEGKCKVAECKAKEAACKAADTCCDNGKCQDDAGKDVEGETEGKCKVAECKATDAACKGGDTCCDNGKCQANGNDVAAGADGTCKVG